MENQYKKSDSSQWKGRNSGTQQYLHEKVQCLEAGKIKASAPSSNKIALLGYACDEGVRRNQGRPGAAKGPAAIRGQLGKLPNHFPETTTLTDVGDIQCLDGNMEAAQEALAAIVYSLAAQGVFTLVLGGGHDIAYGHYKGLRQHIGNDKTLGILNFDAHFDLRKNIEGNNSGTPFYQIAKDCLKENIPFSYLCLGIRKDANTRELYSTARELNVSFLERPYFSMAHLETVTNTLKRFLSEVDKVYITIDLDGFSSAYAPGVSAASPMGFAPDIVLECLRVVIQSGKLISADVAEINPTYDKDDQTAKLAASLLHYIMHEVTLL